MAEYRDVYIEKGLSLGDSGTKTIDVTTSEPITGLSLIFKATNGTSGNKANKLAQCISKVEVVDGADVLVSLNGQQLDALGFYEHGRLPDKYYTEGGGNSQYEAFVIPFARHFTDTDLALVPARFSNLQVKIQWDLAAVRAVGTTGFTSGSLSVDVIAHINRDARNARGFLTTKEIYSFTPAASGEERISLPTDYPYRFLFFQGKETLVNVWSKFTKAKLTVERDKFVVFEYDVDDLARLVRTWYGTDVAQIEAFNADGGTVYTPFWYVVAADVFAQVTYSVANVSGITAESVDIGLYTRDATNGLTEVLTDELLYVNVHGTLPWGVIPYQFGNRYDPTDWFPAPAYSHIELILTQGNAGGEGTVFVQQYRQY